MNTKKRLVPAEFLIPFILITSLFALWGFANDITNPLVSAFKKILKELTNTEAALVQLAFYGGYATMAIPAALFIKRFTYKWGIMVGLILYATGAFLFYPAAQKEQFGFFLAALYILTFGLAFLETTSNPYILFMGPPETATRRLNLAQSFNPMGSLLGMLTAQLYIIRQLQSDDYTDAAYASLDPALQASIRTNDLGVIRDPYVILGFVVIAILVIIAFAKMPKSQDGDRSLNIRATFSKLFRLPRYYEGVITQAFYVGAQIMCWTFIFQYVDALNLERPADQQLTATWYNMAAMVSFLSFRWVCTYLLKYFRPAGMLTVFAAGGVLASAGTMFLPGIAGLYSLVAISVFMSLMFPTIYGISLRDLGDDAKLGSALLVMAIVGGALMPPLQGRILDIGGSNFNDTLILGVSEVRFSFILPLICLAVVGLYGFRRLKDS